ncbi:MAG: HD domain-containing protein [Ruminococcus sp.]|nr:HD domain-containing protein [Ruminococcus sp.]
MQKLNTGKLSKPRTVSMFLGLVICGILLNLVGSNLNSFLNLPFYLDNVGTVLISCIGGYLPGITVGFFSNIISGFSNGDNTYYCFITVLIAVAASYFSNKGFMYRFPHVLLAVLSFSFIGGVLGSLLTWFLYGFGFGSGISVNLGDIIIKKTGMNPFAADMIANFIIDLVDKAIVTVAALIIIRLLPKSFLRGFKIFNNEISFSEKITSVTRKKLSLRAKVLLFVGFSTSLVAISATVVCVIQYHNLTINEYIKTGESVTEMMANNINPEEVDYFIEKGSRSEKYTEIENMLYNVRSCSYEIKFIYVYRITPQGSRVVFDLDSDNIQADYPGDLIELEEHMKPRVNDFTSGKKIDPIITNSKFGWNLTVYRPINFKNGKNCCYAAVDLSMDTLLADEVSFLARIISIFLGFLTLILVFALWIAEHYLIHPINRIAFASSSIVYDSEQARKESLKRIDELDIQNGDEIENLYNAINKNTYDTVGYIEDIQNKSRQINKLQSGLIMVLADLVESRDQCTGDHIRKTAAYTRIIMEQMKKEGIYSDILTDEYIEDVVNSAPLHDIGKIAVPDALLNKTGKLTEEEFKLMQNHTSAGGDIIEKAIKTVDEDSGYLSEAKNLATYHHEKWNGKGYPQGLSGEDIPLSARIMAVADVFDALVSRRSYKEPFSIDKAIDIIRNDAGTHFDENVVKAFLDAEDEIRRVAEMNMDK